MSAVSVKLSAFAAERRRMLHGARSYRLISAADTGAQQQTHRWTRHRTRQPARTWSGSSCVTTPSLRPLCSRTSQHVAYGVTTRTRARRQVRTCCYRSLGQTDTRTPDRCIDAARHTMWTSSTRHGAAHTECCGLYWAQPGHLSQWPRHTVSLRGPSHCRRQCLPTSSHSRACVKVRICEGCVFFIKTW